MAETLWNVGGTLRCLLSGHPLHLLSGHPLQIAVQVPSKKGGRDALEGSWSEGSTD